jgi:D-3-phosphoglycerate dehydrogenase
MPTLFPVGLNCEGAGHDVYGEEPLSKSGHPLSEIYAMDNVTLFPHLTFYSGEVMQRLEQETLQRCFEILQGEPMLIKSEAPRLQGKGVIYGTDQSTAVR